MIINDKLTKIKSLPITKGILKVCQDIKHNPKCREILIFGGITYEFINEVLQNQILTPTIGYIGDKYNKLK